MSSGMTVSTQEEDYTVCLNGFVENHRAMVHGSALQEKINQKLQKHNWDKLHRRLKRGSLC